MLKQPEPPWEHNHHLASRFRNLRLLLQYCYYSPEMTPKGDS